MVKYKNNRYKSNSDYLYIFEDSNSLTAAILFLYRTKKYIKSTLYKSQDGYRLIISSRKALPCLLTLREYSHYSSRCILEIERTKELCCPLIKRNAVKTYGKYFSKGF
jgi:hypothetical protein